MAKIQAVIFDLFGTLVPSTDPESKIIEAFELEAPYKEVQKIFCGKALNEINEAYLQDLMAKLEIPKTQENLIKLERILKRRLAIIKPFPDVLPILRYLKEQNIKLGLVTISWTPGIEKIKQFGIFDFFDSVIRSDECLLFKPNPIAYKKCLKELGVKAENTIMVGDSLKNDVIAPTKIGIKGILLNRTGKEIDSKEPLTVISDLEKLKKITAIGLLEK